MARNKQNIFTQMTPIAESRIRDARREQAFAVRDAVLASARRAIGFLAEATEAARNVMFRQAKS